VECTAYNYADDLVICCKGAADLAMQTMREVIKKLQLEVQAAIDAMPASNHLTYLITGEGNPFTAAGFGNWFRDMCRDANLPTRCTSHGLRKAAATYLAELGATDHQLMAWFGWTSISQAQVYTKAARAKVLAKATGRLITGTGIGSPANPVSQNDDQEIEIVRSGK
jgi:site-specific recombinase XerD